MDLVTIGPFNDGKMAASEFRNKILQLFRLSAAARGRHGGTPDTSFRYAYHPCCITALWEDALPFPLGVSSSHVSDLVEHLDILHDCIKAGVPRGSLLRQLPLRSR